MKILVLGLNRRASCSNKNRKRNAQIVIYINLLIVIDMLNAQLEKKSWIKFFSNPDTLFFL